MLLDAIVIDDGNCLLFVTPSGEIRGRPEMEIMMGIHGTVKRSSPITFGLLYILNVYI